MRIDTNAVYPTISVVRERGNDGAEYFDYFYDSDNATAAIETLNSAWHTPLCGKAGFAAGAKACMNYHIGKCLGPCAGLVDSGFYHEIIGEVIGFLRGESTSKLEEVRYEMDTCSENMLFEKAAACHTLLERLEWLRRKAASRMYDFSRTRRVVLLIRPYNADGFSMFYFIEGQVAVREDVPKYEHQSDFDGIIEDFARAVSVADKPLADSGWLKNALVEILADKCYITLADDADVRRDTEMISKAVSMFAK